MPNGAGSVIWLWLGFLQMFPDSWVLVFLARGIIASAGDSMPLDQCVARSQWVDSAVCISTHDPSCRVYKDGAQREVVPRCIRRMRVNNEPQRQATSQETGGNMGESKPRIVAPINN